MVITEEARRFGGMGGATWTRENIWQRHCSLLPPLWLRGQGCFAGWRVTSPCRSTSSPSRVCGLVVLEVEEMSLTEVARSRRGEWDVDKKRVCDCMLLYLPSRKRGQVGLQAGDSLLRALLRAVVLHALAGMEVGDLGHVHDCQTLQ